MASEEKALVLLKQIGNELQLLWYQMSAYQELFQVEQEKRKVLLQDSAPGFFAITQVSLAESILMRILRLMDPAKTGRDNNNAFLLMHDVLNSEDKAQQSLRAAIKRLCDTWNKNGEGPYSRLKVIRNKWLAHNDTTVQADQDLNQLWQYLSLSDFGLAQQLADDLWSLYQQSSQVLRGTDVCEPAHATLAQRPAMILRQLCASQFLYRSLNESDEQALDNWSALQAYEHERMGDDRIRNVFTTAEKLQ